MYVCVLWLKQDETLVMSKNANTATPKTSIDLFDKENTKLRSWFMCVQSIHSFRNRNYYSQLLAFGARSLIIGFSQSLVSSN